MGAMKKLHAAGEREYCIPGHGGMYRLSGDRSWYHLGEGPRPEYRPSPDELRRYGINRTKAEWEVAGYGSQKTLF